MTAAVPDAAGVLAELRRWIEASWDPELSLVHWRELLADAGWACPAWPRGWCGRSLPAGLAALVKEELAGAEVPGPADDIHQEMRGARSCTCVIPPRSMSRRRPAASAATGSSSDGTFSGTS